MWKNYVELISQIVCFIDVKTIYFLKEKWKTTEIYMFFVYM